MLTKSKVRQKIRMVGRSWVKLLNGNRLRAITSGWKFCINFSLSSSALSLLVGLVGAAASATAGPITDNINFTGEQLNPTFGQFSSYSGPQLFSGFTVVWSDRTLDFTAAANMPEVNDSDQPQAPDFFAYLNRSGYWERVWFAGILWGGDYIQRGEIYGGCDAASMQIGHYPIYPLCASSLNLAAESVSEQEWFTGDFLHSNTFGSYGNFSVEIAPSAVPEPSSWVLMLGGGALLAWLTHPSIIAVVSGRRRRVAKRSCQNSR